MVYCYLYCAHTRARCRVAPGGVMWLCPALRPNCPIDNAAAPMINALLPWARPVVTLADREG